MANTLPINIPIPAESAIASYDYTDIADGAGYTTFDCFATTSSTATAYIMARNGSRTSPGVISALFNNTTGTQTVEFITSAFNTPRILKGKVLLYISHGSLTTNSSHPATSYVTATLKQNSTSLGSAISPTGTTGATIDTIFVHQNVLEINITTPVNIKIGDTLTLSVVQTCGAGGISNKVFYIWFDPLDTAITSSYTVNPTTADSYLKVRIPFKIQL